MFRCWIGQRRFSRILFIGLEFLFVIQICNQRKRVGNSAKNPLTGLVVVCILSLQSGTEETQPDNLSKITRLTRLLFLQRLEASGRFFVHINN